MRLALGLWFTSTVTLLACQRDNPAFEGDDELADAATDSESGASESGESGSGESGSADATDGSTDTGTSETTTAESSTLDTTSTSDDATSTSEGTTSDTTDVSEDTTDGGIVCGEGLTECDGVCVDIEADPMNCGGCGSLCNDNELCLGDCQLKKYVFVTSQPHNGAMNGIIGADDFCNALAFEAGLPGDYLAWNSTGLSYPDFDFVQDAAVYVRTDEQIVALSYDDLTDGNILVPINIDENGLGALASPVLNNCPNTTGAVWSNTTPLGAFALGPNCLDWTSNSIQILGKIGSANATDGQWSQVPDCSVPCSIALAIYCVQQNP